MNPNKTKQLQLLERRKIVAEEYLSGKNQWEISEIVGVSQRVVSHDLQAIRKEWRESAIMNFAERQEEELAKIDNLERVAWEAWERSCQDAETRNVEKIKGRFTKEGAPMPDMVKESRTVKGQCGDPRFLDQVQKCIDRRCKLLGIDTPEEHELTIEERRIRLIAIINSLSKSYDFEGDGTVDIIASEPQDN